MSTNPFGMGSNGVPKPSTSFNAQLEVEQQAFTASVDGIVQWWKTTRQSHVQRPYSAKTVAALRGTQLGPCVANQAALKLWQMLQDHRRDGTAEMTFGATDPVGVSQMAKYMRTVYLSGGLSGFSENNYPGMDHADYVSISLGEVKIC